MGQSLQQLLDVDFTSAIDSVFNSRPDLDLNSKGPSPLDLDDSFEYAEGFYAESEPVSLRHSEFDLYESFTKAQLTELHFDDPQIFQNALLMGTQQQQQPLTAEAEVAVSDKAYPKPTLSYPCLSALALKNSQTGKLLVTQIYSFICQHFPYYRTAPKAWKNSVRHNLAHNETFQKLDAATSGCTNKRSNLWFVNPAKVAEVDQKLRETSRKHSKDVREAMSHPKHLEMLVNGEMKSGSNLDEQEQEFMSEFLMFPSAKRQKTLDGEAKGTNYFKRRTASYDCHYE